MATFSKSFSNNSKYTLILTVTEVPNSTNIVNNTTDVDWELKMTSGSASFASWVVDSSVSLNGENVFSNSVKTSLSPNSTLVLGSGRKTIKHDDNGKKTISCSGSVSTATSQSYLPGSASVSGDLTLTTIPRKSEVTCPSFNAGDSTNIVISKKDSSFTSTIRYIFGDLSETIATKTKETVVGWTPDADDFYAQFPDAKQKSGIIYCDTYSGNTLIGTSETSFTCYAKESECIPDVSLVVKDFNPATKALTNNENVIVKGISDARLDLAYTLKNGATIKSTVISCGDGQRTNAINDILYKVNSGVFKAIVTDSRDFSKTVTVEKTVENGLLVDYVKLAITSVDPIGRTESTSNVIKVNIKGNYYNGNFSTEKANSLKLTYRYRETGGEWSSQPIEVLNQTINVTEWEEFMGGDMSFNVEGGINGGETYYGPIPSDDMPNWIKTETNEEGDLIANVYVYTTTGYTELTPTITENTFSFNGSLGDNFDYKKQYEFEFYAEDELMYVSASDKPIIVTKGISIIRVGDGYVDIRGDLLQNGKVFSGGEDSITGDTLPIGSMIPYGKSTAPTNWLICDGSAVSRTTYAELFAVIGTSYGAGDGSTTFNLPNKKGRVSVGLDTSDSKFNAIGKTGGSATHKLTVNEMPSHKHEGIEYDNNGNGVSLSENGNTGYNISWNGSGNSSRSDLQTSSAGGSQAHNNLQPYQVDCWIIKAFQSAGVVAEVVNTESASTTDTYSCDYINHIVESGSNENGSWTKWADGTMICTKTISGKVDLYLWVTPIYYGDVQCGKWAQTFNRLDGVSHSCDSSQAWITVYNQTKSSAGSVRFISTNNGFKDYIVRLTAIGKWK